VSRRWTDSPVATALGIDLPLIGAPLAGGPTTPALVAAVSEAGGLGVLGGGYSAPDRLREEIRAVRELTGRPFGVNLMVPQPYEVDPDAVAAAAELFQPYADELGLSRSPRPDRYAENFEDQLAVVLDEGVPVFGFTFGIPAEPAVRALRDAGTVLMGTATSVAEARALDAAGIDLVYAQGAEAGGHRGSFLAGDAEPGLVGLVALIPQVCDAVDRPVIASGGIMDGRGIAAALMLGASAAALGTAFMRCPEAGTNPAYRAALAAAEDTGTVLTRAFSGKPARGLRNRMTEELAGTELPPFPVTNALTRGLRGRAAELGRSDYLSLWAGQGAPMGRELPAAELVRRLAAETDAALGEVGPRDQP
jgi:nitronate monooxygenase